MQAHFLCIGNCGATAALATICENPDCPMFNLDFKPCDCTDGQHSQHLALQSAGDDVWDDEGSLAEVDEDELAEWEDEFKDEKE